MCTKKLSIVMCALYYPPRCQYQHEYIDHITSVIDYVLMEHPDAGIFVVGDMNDLNIQPILNNDGFHQVIHLPTRENNILDKIITNCSRFYSPVILMSPLGRSDHNCVLLIPLKCIFREKNEIKKKFVRPLPDSGLRSFGQWITCHSWNELSQISDPSEKCSLFIDTTRTELDKCLPVKEVKICKNDKPWMTPEVKDVFDKRENAFIANDKTKWRRLRNKVDRMIISAKRFYYNIRVSHLKLTNPAAWYKQIKFITKKDVNSPCIAVPNVEPDDPEHRQKTADAINEHFISVASDLPPLDRCCLPAYLPSLSVCPRVQPHEVYLKLRKIKCNKAGLSDDLPPRVVREFACELCQPLADILNASFQQGIVPWQWKRGQIIPIPKCQPPKLDQLRPICLTSQFAKIAESFITQWLLDDISKYIDPHQYGNRPGLSTSHYLIKLLHEMYKNCERSKSISTIVCTDFSKAFDRLDHNILV